MVVVLQTHTRTIEYMFEMDVFMVYDVKCVYKIDRDIAALDDNIKCIRLLTMNELTIVFE